MIGHTTTTELRLRHAELEASAQRLRERAAGMDPTRATTSGTMRLIRATQKRADDYARILSQSETPPLDLDRMEVHLVGALGAVRETSGVEITDAAVAEVLYVVGNLFSGWRSQP